MTDPGGANPVVGVVLPVMDRAPALAHSLPTLLAQDYPALVVTVVDLGSEDGMGAVLRDNACPRLRHLRCPRPEHFSFATAANIGIRYSASDLLLIWGVDSLMADTGVLSRAVAALVAGAGGDRAWLQSWRRSCSYPPVAIPASSRPPFAAKFPPVYLLDGGGLLLVERAPVQALGGFNEWLDDWGYKDTDLNFRLELAGYGRLPFPGIATREHGDSVRVARLRYPNKEATWQRNREVADLVTRRLGPCTPSSAGPGALPWLEIDGVCHGETAPQQDWQFGAGFDPSLEAEIRAIRAAHERSCLAPPGA